MNSYSNTKASDTVEIINTQYASETIVLCLSGLTADRYALQHIVSNLNQPTLLIDNLGINQNIFNDKAHTIEAMAQFVMKKITLLIADKSLIIIGHSMGGAIAQELYKLLPKKITKLVFISTFTKLDTVGCKLLQARYQMAKQQINADLIFDSFSPTLFGNCFLENTDKLNFARDRFKNNAQSIQGMLGQLNAITSYENTRISKIKVPTTIITGQDDLLVAPKHSQYLANQIPNNQLIEIENCGHMVQFEQPTILEEIVMTEI